MFTDLKIPRDYIITKEALQYKKKKKKFITTKNMLLTKYIGIQDVQYVI